MSNINDGRKVKISKLGMQKRPKLKNVNEQDDDRGGELRSDHESKGTLQFTNNLPGKLFYCTKCKSKYS